jgi:oligoribonuclease (3'-5' exoribonuclease)
VSFRFPYVSIDIETTGLDRQKVHVLQLAAVYDNGKDVEDLPTFDRVIKWPVISHAEEYAMNLNRGLLSRAYKNDRVVSINNARLDFENWLDKIQPSGRFTAAGKNIQGFDMPILVNPVNDFNMRRFLHRALDPGSMYTDEFDHVPTLDEINTVTGRKAVTHDALDDAWDVVYAIRHKWR